MSEVAHIPQLRFPEFDGVWESGLLKDAVKINPRSGELPDEFIYIDLESVKKGYLIKGTQINKIGAPSRAQRLLNKNDVIFQTVRPYQKNNYFFNLDGDYVASTGYAQLRVLNSPEFLYQALHTDRFVYDVMARSTGTSYPAINSTDLSKIKLNLPTKLEQQKIAAFLTTVDNKIEQLSKKQELLGEYKKGLMQKIFSQAIRFKADDGSEFPDWEEKKLDDVSDCLDNRRQPLNGAERNQMKGDIPYYGANGIVDYVNDYIFDEELVLLAEDGGNFNDFSSKPIAQKISGKAWVNNHAHILKAKNIIATDFLFYSLVHKDIRRYIVGGSRAKLNKSDLLSIKTILPPLEEQTKIANFLSSIDNKIEQVGKQLDESKQFKKALLQQMFV